MTCFDRDSETRDLWQRFQRGQNLLMLAPRRIGKTVLLNRLRETAAGHGFRAIVLDVEGFREEKDFFRQCCAAIQEEIGTGAAVMTAFTGRLKRVMKGGNDGDDWRQWLVNTDWKDFADHLLAHLDEHGASQEDGDQGRRGDDLPWLILVDELPVFVQALAGRGGPDAVGDFLYWLRNMRQKYGRIRWLYTGSIGLDSVTRRFHVEGALNDLDPFALKPFSPATALAFLEDVGTRRDRTFEPAAADRVLERLGWLSPYYLEKVAEDACVHAVPGRPVTVPEVDASMDRMLDLEKRTYWSTWREHLDKNFPEAEQKLLYAILEAVARADGSVGRDVLLSAVNRPAGSVTERELRDRVDTLVSDGYLDVVDGRIAFRMNLLREWWRRFVVL